MATKDGYLLLKDKQKLFGSNNSHGGNKFSNLNLNQSSKCPILIPLQSCSKLYNEKFYDSSVSDNYAKTKKSQTWNKSSKISKFTFLNRKTDATKKRRKKTSTSDANNSTLSLHISAYENSTETKASDLFCEKLGKVISGSIKNQENSKIFSVSTFNIQHPFEFPRQQENDETRAPEVSQFKASQKLLNPNEASKNDQQVMPSNCNNVNNSSDSSSNSGDEINNESNLSTTPIPLKIAPAVEAVATKYLKKGTIIESSNTHRKYEVLEILKRGNLCVIVKLQERNVPLWQKNKTFSLKAECGPVMDEEIGLKIELNILAKAAEARHLRPAMVDNIVEIFDRGITDNFRFIVVTSLGMNLSDLQKSVKGLPMQTAVRINKRMFNAIRNLHTLGFIHRNIQPSNFAIGSQKAHTAIVFIIGFSLAARIEMDSNGSEIDVSKMPQHPTRRINTLNSMYMSRRCHSTLNLSRLDDIESWLFSCLEICMMDCLPWKKCFIASEALEMKKDFFFHQYTFELFFERIPVDYRRIIDIINSSLPKSTPDYSKISEINDKICKLYPTMHKKKPTAASPIMDTTKSLMLPTICLPVQSNPSEDTHSFYGVPTKDVFPVKGKPKEMKSKNVRKTPTSAPAILPAPKENAKKKSNKATAANK